MRSATAGWFWYFGLTLPLKLDLFLSGPISQTLSAVTGLPIN